MKKRIQEELDDWANLGVEAHFDGRHPWVSTDEPLLENMSNIVGAQKEEVAIMNSLSTNMHLMMVPFYRPTDTRFKILTEAGAFPSDRYGVESQLRLHDIDLKEGLIELSPREGETYLRTEDILKVIEEQGQSIALVFFSGVQYYTGQLFDMESITKAGHEQGCRVGFDLAHAVGNAPLKLHDWNVDFAVWCCYKYLNSGPGTIGGCFVHGRLTGVPQEDGKVVETGNDLKRLAGWWGQEQNSRFTMLDSFNPIPGASGFRLSNPPVLCVASLDVSLQVFAKAGFDKLRSKSLLLTGYLEYLIDNTVPSGHIKIITPRDPNQRGCQLSLLFSHNAAVVSVSSALAKGGLIADVRKPNVMRIAPVPLYNSFTDVWKFVELLRNVLTDYDKSC